jgi:hypothetical protein
MPEELLSGPSDGLTALPKLISGSSSGCKQPVRCGQPTNICMQK